MNYCRFFILVACGCFQNAKSFNIVPSAVRSSSQRVTTAIPMLSPDLAGVTTENIQAVEAVVLAVVPILNSVCNWVTLFALVAFAYSWRIEGLSFQVREINDAAKRELEPTIGLTKVILGLLAISAALTMYLIVQLQPASTR
jgi:hypothetical protein